MLEFFCSRGRRIPAFSWGFLRSAFFVENLEIAKEAEFLIKLDGFCTQILDFPSYTCKVTMSPHLLTSKQRLFWNQRTENLLFKKRITSKSSSCTYNQKKHVFGSFFYILLSTIAGRGHGHMGGATQECPEPSKKVYFTMLL